MFIMISATVRDRVTIKLGRRCGKKFFLRYSGCAADLASVLAGLPLGKKKKKERKAQVNIGWQKKIVF